MPQMMPVVLSYERNTMVKNYQAHFFQTHLWILSKNGELQNKRPMVSITPQQNGMAISRDLA